VLTYKPTHIVTKVITISVLPCYIVSTDNGDNKIQQQFFQVNFISLDYLCTVVI